MNYSLQKPTLRRRSALFSTALASLAFLLASCGSSGDPTLEDKRNELAELKGDLTELQKEIADLENEIRTMQDTSGIEDHKLAVTVLTLQAKDYKNPVELQGLVESDKNVMLSGEAGGTVTRIYVKEGQRVSRGQLVASLDASVLGNSIGELRTALDLANINYEKQDRLWNELKIGSEMQYLEAKNRKEAIEKQLATVQSQAAKYAIRSPIRGVVDQIFVNAGELTSPGFAVMRVVDASQVKVTADVSERYVGKLNNNDSVLVRFPAIQDSTVGVIRAVGQVIDIENRTFSITVDIDNERGHYKPNLLAMITAYDFRVDSALVAPARLINVVNDTSFVFVAEPSRGDTVARKIAVATQILDNRNILVRSGLAHGQWLIDDGYRSVSDGDLLRVTRIN